MERQISEEYRARARAERASAAKLRGTQEAEAASALADSFERVAEAYERLIGTRQAEGPASPNAGTADPA